MYFCVGGKKTVGHLGHFTLERAVLAVVRGCIELIRGEHYRSIVLRAADSHNRRGLVVEYSRSVAVIRVCVTMGCSTFD